MLHRFRLVRRALCAAVAAALGTAAASGAIGGARAGDRPVEIERMTWVAVRDRIAAGTRTIIIPTGGTEQNGPHMALGKHNVIVAETARRIARALGDTLVAPVVAYVPEGDVRRLSGHMAYAGTITVPDAVFTGVLEAAAASFKAHGFREIVLLGDSGGNQAPQVKLAARLNRAWSKDGVRVMNAARYYGDNGGDALLASAGEGMAAIGTHAGIRDTSELMAIAPGLVDLSKAGPDRDGATGDARRASAARGAILLAGKVDAAVAEIKAWRAGTAPAPAQWPAAGFWR